MTLLVTRECADQGKQVFQRTQTEEHRSQSSQLYGGQCRWIFMLTIGRCTVYEVMLRSSEERNASQNLRPPTEQLVQSDLRAFASQ